MKGSKLESWVKNPKSLDSIQLSFHCHFVFKPLPMTDCYIFCSVAALAMCIRGCGGGASEGARRICLAVEFQCKQYDMFLGGCCLLLFKHGLMSESVILGGAELIIAGLHSNLTSVRRFYSIIIFKEKQEAMEDQGANRWTLPGFRSRFHPSRHAKVREKRRVLTTSCSLIAPRAVVKLARWID